MSCAVFSSFFLPTSFRGKSAFTLSRGAWHLSLTTEGISSISKRCWSIGGSGLSGWKALCCKHCKKQNNLSKVELSIILKTFNVMSVHHMVYNNCKIFSILNILPLYCWKIFSHSGLKVYDQLFKEIINDSQHEHWCSWVFPHSLEWVLWKLLEKSQELNSHLQLFTFLASFYL